MPGFRVYHKLPGFAQIHVRQVGDAIQPSHPLWLEVVFLFLFLFFAKNRLANYNPQAKSG